VAPVLALTGDVHELSRRALTCPEMSIVEDQHRHPRRRESSRVPVQSHLPRTPKTMTHHHEGTGFGDAVGRIQPRRALLPARRETDLDTFHGDLPYWVGRGHVDRWLP